ISTSKPTGHDIHFGGAGKVYNVIDTRQSYLQKIVVQGLKALDYRKQAEQSVHFSYEMVALSPKSLKELNLEVSDADRDRSFVEVSGRKGLGVKADDLLDRLEEKARAEVARRNPDFSSEQSDAIARAIAVGALRYFMLKFTRNSLIVFDFDEALSFEGETGPYLQYTVVRINSIFRKLEEREGLNDGKIRSMQDTFDWNPEDAGDEEKNDFWELILYASQLEEEVLRAIHALEFSHLAKFTFNLCQKLNGYYHKYSILSETDTARKNGRILTISLVRDVLRQALTLMGIPEPERM
ncbi:MAG: arginine--tRNA ligase, partial [Acidobacteria bacterium]|nr:arginine--tRNA ligase [Acidobacteriota bacterium]MBU1474771.1 arginine--tRNA ligase [Acidobacteriota bacterium]